MTARPSAGSTPVSAVIGDPVARVGPDATVADAGEAIAAADPGFGSR
ncbi:hypothetical protein [Mycobacterium sp.]|nr:hypothetical protein [Mycobacterium sp.]HME47827.1 hypothetical protein [Mycobacterium sp.]